MLERDASGQPTLEISPTSPYRRRLVRLAFFAPVLQSAILSGRQPRGMTLAGLMKVDLPLCWEEQIQRFGPVHT